MTKASWVVVSVEGFAELGQAATQQACDGGNGFPRPSGDLGEGEAVTVLEQQDLALLRRQGVHRGRQGRGALLAANLLARRGLLGR